MLVKKLQLLQVRLPDVTREQIKFTLFSDIQLTFLIYIFFCLKYINLFYLE